MFSTLKTLTAWLIIAVFVGLIAADVWLASTGHPTESRVMASWGQHTVSVPYLAGVLCGHWFLNQKIIWRSAWGYAAIVFVFTIPWDILWNAYHWQPQVIRYPAGWLALGALAGMLFWGQTD